MFIAAALTLSLVLAHSLVRSRSFARSSSLSVTALPMLYIKPLHFASRNISVSSVTESPKKSLYHSNRPLIKDYKLNIRETQGYLQDVVNPSDAKMSRNLRPRITLKKQKIDKTPMQGFNS